MPLGEGSHGSILNGNYAAARVTSGWKSTLLGSYSKDTLKGGDLDDKIWGLSNNDLLSDKTVRIGWTVDLAQIVCKAAMVRICCLAVMAGTWSRQAKPDAATPISLRARLATTS
jgi:hypothetical protein